MIAYQFTDPFDHLHGVYVSAHTLTLNKYRHKHTHTRTCRKVWFVTRSVSTLSPVSGLVQLRVYHAEMAARSYVLPSMATTGSLKTSCMRTLHHCEEGHMGGLIVRSSGRACVRGQQNSAGACGVQTRRSGDGRDAARLRGSTVFVGVTG